ncbi:MAG: gliding motility-associated ABC transporter substrate-binding protein GldG [Cyclobacteriaceae bacterium]|jgi:gliding-associated putative ABC transporter substrate-binding component GldG|nr:gliding motility-associated ABC transporter substrate-binding protein GldG [Cytophagales bacterium]HNP76027.1 gliding motility-associated ABC transporter substrate-binding protein GldG [Cyclobacteriaceae bacterium]HQQ83922.1 gliding motility-associated ABC transporter substrate-binding protein GldG [Cyclobacteriaceae bacterium]
MVSGKKYGDWLLLANGLVFALVLNQLASLYFFRIDLTEESRYTMKAPTRALLESLDDDVYVEVYLEGNINAGFQRLYKAVGETLEEFRVYSNNKVHYTFLDPAAAKGQEARKEFMLELAGKGIQPMNIIANTDGRRTEKLVFPGAVISYGGAEEGVMLVKGNRAQGSDEVLNQSIEGLEYQFALVIEKLAGLDRKKVGWVTGHGELDSLQAAGFSSALRASFDLVPARLDKNLSKELDVLIIARPTRWYSPADKFYLDQFIMRGGSVLVLIDRLEASMDSVSMPDYFARPFETGLEDPLFHYGVRVNPDAVQDLQALRFPVITGNLGGKPQMTPIEWPFFPLINQYADHPATRNMDATPLRMTSSLDTVKAIGIRKTPLMFTSAYARRVASPVKMSINDLRKDIRPENFNAGPIPVAYLLEGEFTSVFKNRFLPEGVDSTGYRSKGKSAKLLVVGDGDLARNEINPRNGQPQPLGFDAFTNTTYANAELLINMVAYLADEHGLITARTKDIKIRPLDKEQIRAERWKWQAINLVLPVLLLAGLGIAKTWARRKRYGSFIRK